MANEKGIKANLENMTANKLLDIANDDAQPVKLRAAAKKELSTRSMGDDTMPGKARTNFKDGGKATKKVPAVAISFGMVDAPKNGKNKAKMMRGGTANKREHMYAAGGSVTDNAGLHALKKASPAAYNKITKS